MNAGFLDTALLTLAWLAAGAYGVAVLERWIVPARAGARGVHALLQPLSSAARLLRAGNPLPARPDSALFRSAPLVAVATVALAAWAVPWSPTAAVDTPITLFFFVILLGPFVVALANAGWGANGKYGLLASMRAASHLVAYEVVLGFAILGPAMASESLSLVRIAQAQERLWFVVWQPLGLVLYLVSVLFAVYRRPFDTPIAGSELAGGALAEYGGARLLLFRAALSALLFLVAAVGAVTYLGGWHGPPGVAGLLPGSAWMLLKTYALVALLLWVGRRTPRFGHDQMLRFSWKVVLPLAFVNLAATGILILVLDP
jgi:NADH-quinone oxidoreductase subunit H